MTDSDFLDYCMAMTATERCGFVPQNIARLLRLAGDEDSAARWEDIPIRIVSGCHDQVRDLVAIAANRIRRAPS